MFNLSKLNYRKAKFSLKKKYIQLSSNICSADDFQTQSKDKLASTAENTLTLSPRKRLGRDQ